MGAGCGLAAAEPSAPLPATLQRAQSAAHDLAAVRLPFTQIKHLAILEEPLTTAGALEIDRQAGALRWEFTGQSVLILAKGRLRRWGPDGREEDLGNDPSAQALAGQMQALVTGDWAPLGALFALADGPAVADGQDRTVVFTPLTPEIGRFIAKLTIAFAASGLPSTMQLDTAGGDRTEYRFAPPVAGWQPAAARFSGP